MQRFVAALFTLVLTMGLVACGGNSAEAPRPTPASAVSQAGAAQIALVAQDITFNIKSLQTKAGEPVVLDFSNTGVLEHDFTIDEIPMADDTNGGGHADDGHSTPTEAAHSDDDHSHADDASADAHNEIEQPDLHFHLDAGQADTFTFTPTEPGTYEYYCSVAGHREAGMVGTLTVE